MTYSSDRRAHPLILGLNFLKLTISKIDFETYSLEIGSKIYSADIHCITRSTYIIIIPTSDIYRPCQLPLNKKACWMVIFKLTAGVVLTAVASHTQCHFKPPSKKQKVSFASPACNFNCQITTREPKRTGRLYLLNWAIPPVLAETLNLTNHLFLGVYNPLHPQIPPWSKRSRTLVVALS